MDAWDAMALIGLVLIAVGLWEHGLAFGLGVPGALLFLLAVFGSHRRATSRRRPEE